MRALRRALIEVDSYGTLIAGCLMCNDWRSVDGMRRVKLPDADVEALRKIQHPATP